ncbi:MAG: hypothetical protein ACRD2J_00555 [Thermoanaerobaculia bacterium]
MAAVRFFAALLTLTAASALGTSVILELVPHVAVDPPDSRIELRRIENANDVANALPSHVIDVSSSRHTLVVDLAEGFWSLDFVADDIWHQRQYFDTRSGRTIPVDYWAEAVLGGRIRTDDQREVRTLGATFEAIRSDLGPSGEADCVVDGMSFSCGIPAGTMNVRLRAPGYITRYFGPIDLQPRKTTGLGEVPLYRGQAMVGRVEFGRGVEGELGEVTVTARSMATSTSKGLTAKVDRSGLFHLDGLAPGDYEVAASDENGTCSAPVEITVAAGREAEILRPLVLTRPGRLTISITPPAAPDAQPWHVTLDRPLGGSQVDTVSEGAADRVGTWSAPALQSGDYLVSVTSGDGSTWAHQQVRLDQSDLVVPILVESRSVRGRVVLGIDPITARLEFVDEEKRSVRVEADEQGRFRAVLPGKVESYRVRIESSSPPVRTTLERVELPDEDRELVIELPATSLAGTVVDERGVPSATATVNVKSSAEGFQFIQQDVDAEGLFLLHGLPFGTYRIEADDGLQQSEALAVTFDEENSVVDIEIVLRPSTRLRGRIVSAFGPVEGARVMAVPTDVPIAYAPAPRTGARGEFFIALPPRVREIDLHIAAPGFAYSMGHIGYRDEPFVFALQNNGGMLKLEAPRGTRLRLGHDGATVPVESLRAHWQVVDEGETVVLLEMEPGPYSLCSVESAPRCVEGFLAPYGTTTLDLRD